MSEQDLDFIQVAQVEDLPSGERLFLEIDEQPVVVFNLAGYFYAIADVCTHDDGPLGEGEIDDHQVICPRHGARFDIVTGKALTFPAVVDTPVYAVRVVDGWIEIGLSGQTK